MKKTLTVNLGGTVFHIDEDAYRLLNDYFCNLRIYFKKQEGADEIVNDIENRILELFSEKTDEGVQVITIEYVEDVITRMGKPEELAGIEEDGKTANSTGNASGDSNSGKSHNYSRKRLYRDPNDKILGGVVSGIAAYLGWDVTFLRLIILVILVCGVGTLIPIYIVCWIVIPEAITAAEKLNMRGEEVTVENIGKTVTDGFEKMTNGVNDYIKSDKPRTFIQKSADVFVNIVGIILKLCLIIFAIIFSPVLLVLGIVFIALIIVIIATALGGSAVLFSMLPFDWTLISGSPITALVTSIAGIVFVGIPLVGFFFVVLRQIFNWKPMVLGLKWTLFFLWVVSLIIFFFGMYELNWQFPYWEFPFYTW